MSKENNSDIVFAVQHSNDAVSGNANPGFQYASLYRTGLGGGGYGFIQPLTVLVNSFQVDLNGLPKLDNSYINNIIPECDIRGASDANDADKTIPVDARLDWTVMRGGIPSYNWVMT